MDMLFEQMVVQNTGLGAEAIWQATLEVYNCTGRAAGLPFAAVFLVLPMCFHQRTAKVIASKTKPGAIYKALADDREIIIGLQDRMERLADRTLQSLSISFETKLLTIDQVNDFQLFPLRRSQPVDHTTADVKTIMNAAKRVGQTIAELSMIEIMSHLKVKF